MWQQMVSFLKPWFIIHNLSLERLLITIGLAVTFGAVWLLAHWPPLFKRHWLWAVAVVSAFLTLLAVVFIQIPLQTWAGQALLHFWSPQTLAGWIYLAAIPQILLSGLVQEGAKMVPMVAWWWRRGRQLDPKMGLAIGAVAGAGFGIYEAFWVHTNVLGPFSWQAVQTAGFQALLPFWERFFTVGAHVAMAALSGYGLAKGWGWQFYLIASGMHAVLNYSVILVGTGKLTTNQVEIYIAVMAVVYTAVIMWLRWWKTEEEPSAGPSGPDI
jgi:RsiW-degrading membrane proteinase PrsW (M82 family)